MGEGSDGIMRALLACHAVPGLQAAVVAGSGKASSQAILSEARMFLLHSGASKGSLRG